MTSLADLTRFEVRRHLGSGGMGAVYEAYDHERGSRVALKTLRSQSPEALLQLKNEFRALQDVRHPNLVQLLELSEQAGRYLVSMELVEGEDLLSWVRPGDRRAWASVESATEAVPTSEVSPVASDDDRGEREPPAPPSGTMPALDVERLRHAFGQLATALEALHERGKLHGDVKPANVLVTPEGRVVLVDFGLTVEHDGHRRSAASTAGGTHAFMAPEQAAGQALSPAADWYSFGVALYLALSGQLPFRGANLQRQKLRAQPASLRTLCPGAPEAILRLSHTLLAAEPSARPSGASVLEALGVVVAPTLAHTGFFGRERELSRLRDAYDGARPAQGTCVLVRGDSGVGKSALVRELIRRLEQDEAPPLVLSARCYERDWLPYKALDGIVDELCRYLTKLPVEEASALLPTSARLLPQVFPVLDRLGPLLATLPELEPPREPLERRALAFAALRELFSRLSRHARVLLFIDDLQWADADSHLLLADLLRRPAAPAVCLIATARRERLTAPWLDASGAATLELSALDLDEATHLAGSLLDRSADHALVGWVARESGGHPLFVQALAAHAHRSKGARPEAMRLDDALLAQLDDVAPNSRQLLELLAVSGTPLGSGLARLAAGHAPSEFADEVSDLRARRLVRSTPGEASDELSTYHDRLREALLDRLTPETRRARHRELVTALESSGRGAADPQTLVRHLEGAGEVASAAEQAELAAKRADGALAFDQAAELYATALRLGGIENRARKRLNLGRAEALANAGRAAESAESYLDAAQLSSALERQDYERRAAMHLLRGGHSERGIAILSRVLRDMGDRFLSQRGSLAATLYERLRLRLRGSSWQLRDERDVDPELLRSVDAYHALGVSLSLIDPARGARFEAMALRRALDAGEPRRLGAAAVLEACYESAVGEAGAKAARRWSRVVDEVLERVPDPYVRAACGIRAGFLAYHAGQYAESARVLGETEQALARVTGTYFEQAFCHCFRLIALRNRGQFRELTQGYAEWVRRAERRGDRFTEASLRFNLNGVFLASDEPERALAELSRVSWMPPAGGYHVQHWYAEQAHAELSLYTGRFEDGLARLRKAHEALKLSLIARLRLHRSHAHWLLVRFLLAAPASTPRLAEVERLVARLAKERIGYATVWARLGAAGLAERRGQRRAATRYLGQALTEAELADLPQYAAAARYRLGRLDGVAANEAAALAFAAEQGLVRPERWFASWAPGFE